MNTYTDPINEFVDWVSGDNVWTGENITGGLPVSGGSIRQLLQSRLRNPFVLKEDIANNLYRMFSSETAYQLWLENPSDNADLELFNFVRPSAYKLDFFTNSSNKFVRYGDSSNTDVKMHYTWSIRNDEGESPEGLTATYTISNESTGKSTTFTRWYDKGQEVNFSIYEYLEPGVNSINVLGIGTTSGARSSINYYITLLQLNVSSTFDFTAKRANGDQIQIPCTFTRNDQNGTALIKFIIDEGGTGKEWTHTVNKNSGTQINAGQRITPNLEPGLHTLQIYAEAEYNDGQVQINSNLLYFTFVIATSEISVQKYICLAASFDTGIFPITDFILQSTQYIPSTLRWGYYTDAEQSDTQIQVAWKLYQNDEDEDPEILSTLTANSRQEAALLSYIPTIYSEFDDGGNPLTYLSAEWINGNNSTQLIKLPIQITQNTDISIYETGAYVLKLSAYGKSNDSSSANTWEDTVHNITTTFTGVQWNTNSGWYNNSFRTVGTSEYAEVNYTPFAGFSFTNGRTIEIEFETEKVNEDDDKLIVIGNPLAARIEITPVKATLYANNNSPVVYTNYKSNERIKLAFIINDIPASTEDRTVESGLAYIVNNGILERAGLASGYEFNTSGKIKIGGSNSGVRVYSIRIYNYPITYTDAYNNYVYDSSDKINIVNKNNVLNNAGEISFDLCKNKLDTILISGDLTNILSGQTDKDASTTDVTIERICPYDTTKNFKINNVQIRKHGQSTLNYPITSMKFWLNKSKSGVQPIFEIEPQQGQSYNKNRYKMKNESIPQNKFVLQANYADSSGVHNGGFERLIQSTWFNANIDGEFKLRTLPQLFTTDQTVTHTNSDINDVDERVDGPNEAGHTWSYYSPRSAFPYDVRVAPDSFPCVVFYYDEAGTQQRTFLGQYVFMDDKKSDFLYGERSIYKVPADPFCLTTTHAKDDTKANKIWDNGNVLRIEVLESNNRYSSYTTTSGFNERNGNRYGWETAFEMIYPDPDDIEAEDTAAGMSKFDPNSKFAKAAKPFVDWYTWLVSTKDNHTKFRQEAAQHLDLYKMAAYYIFILRFGLVDSLERNAQIKTYDGVHFHYEPWDMDIALGNKNDGGIAYDPPIDRNTKLPGSVTTYAYSGRSANDQGQIVTSNWLFDALEAWPDWMNKIVPKVADALYNAGLKYNNIINMLDNNYANAWCEILYNKSGFFKYVESGEGDPEWLGWLQGARMTHRHWWLSTSMDYYDAKWFCGDYKNHYIYITANVTEGSGWKVRIKPNKDTYMTTAINYMPDEQTDPDPDSVVVQGTIPVSPNDPLVYEVPNLNTKAPFFVYGANFMEEINLSELATGLDGVQIDGVYSEVLGSPLKVLNIGVNFNESPTNTFTGTLAALGGNIRGNARTFENLQTLNVAGQKNYTDTRIIRDYDMSELKNFNAMGSGVVNFFSSASGNQFNTIKLPSTVSIFDVNNTTWNNLTFWDKTEQSGNAAVITLHEGVPAAIQTLRLNGTSCRNYNSIKMVKDWLQAIITTEGVDALPNHTLEADNILWTSDTVGGNNNLLTYDELALIAQLNGEPDPLTGRKNHKLKGYLVLQYEDEELTTEQLTNIRTWFGDTVFQKNSSGLVVDHMHDYVQINVGGDIRIQNGELYLSEGGRASLSATRFALDPNANEEGDWYVSMATETDPSNIGKSIQSRGINIIDASSTPDGNTYLQTQESQAGGNYDIKVWYSTSGVDQPVTVVIHMTGVIYPDDVTYAIDTTGYAPRTIPGSTIIYNINTAFDIYLDLANVQFDSTINNIQYVISRGTSSFAYNTMSDAEDTSNWDPQNQYITVSKNTKKKGLHITCDSGTPQDDTIITYNVAATMQFKSGKTQTVNHVLLVMQDPEVVTNLQDHLFYALKNRWYAKYGEDIGRNKFYRSDLFTLDGTLTFSTDITSVRSAVGTHSLFEYLPAIEGLNFSGCSSLLSTYTPTGSSTPINMFVFDNMPALTTLNITNCSSLTEDIDLSDCPNITTVTATGTSINVYLPQGSGVTSYSLGTPTEIILDSPTAIAPTNVTVTSVTNLDSLELINIPNNKSFTMFGKIMGIS